MLPESGKCRLGFIHGSHTAGKVWWYGRRKLIPAEISTTSKTNNWIISTEIKWK